MAAAAPEEQNEQKNIQDAIKFLVQNDCHKIKPVKAILKNPNLPKACKIYRDKLLPDECKIYRDKLKRDFHESIHGWKYNEALFGLLKEIYDFSKTFDQDNIIREAPFLRMLLFEIDEETIQFVEEFIAYVKKLSN